MRRIILRVLAGLLSVGFTAILVLGDTAKFSFKVVFGLVILGIAFAMYAFAGSELGGQYLLWILGHRNSRDNLPSDKSVQSSTQNETTPPPRK